MERKDTRTSPGIALSKKKKHTEKERESLNFTGRLLNRDKNHSLQRGGKGKEEEDRACRFQWTSSFLDLHMYSF